LQLARPFGHLQLEPVAGLAELFLGAATLMDEARALECRCGVIRRHGEEQLVGFRGKIAPITCDGNQPTVGIDTDRHDETAARLQTAADVGNDLLARSVADGSEVTVQPLRKCFPRIAARDVDGRTAVGIAQAHEREIEVQRPDQHVGKPGGDRRRFSPDPRRWDRRKRHEIPERCSEPLEVAGIH